MHKIPSQMIYKVKIFILLLHLFLMNQSRLSAQNTDLELLRKINQSNELMRPLSIFTDKWAVPINFGIPAVMGGVGLLSQNKDLIKDAIYVGSSIALDAILVTGLKNAFQRQRPFVTYPDLVDKYADGGNYSFPSGHSSTSFAMAASLTFKYRKWYISAPAYLYAGYVGYSRAHVGVHYPSDVLAGAILGTGSAWLTWELNKLLQKR